MEKATRVIMEEGAVVPRAQPLCEQHGKNICYLKKATSFYLPPKPPSTISTAVCMVWKSEQARAECVEKLKQLKWAKVQEVPPPGNLALQGESSYKSLFQ